MYECLDEVGIDISNHVGAFMSKADLGVRMHGTYLLTYIYTVHRHTNTLMKMFSSCLKDLIVIGGSSTS